MNVQRYKKITRLAGLHRLGQLYMTAERAVTNCDRLPFDLGVCPTCGAGMKPARQAQMIADAPEFIGGIHEPCLHKTNRTKCKMCYPGGSMMLVWLATRMYLPIAWLDEVNRLGVAWPATRIPHAFELGKTTVLVACSKPTASVFAYFIPTGFTTVVKYSETQDFGKMMRLKQRHIVPMFIDDSDEDYLK